MVEASVIGDPAGKVGYSKQGCLHLFRGGATEAAVLIVAVRIVGVSDAAVAVAAIAAVAVFDVSVVGTAVVIAVVAAVLATVDVV